MTRTMGEPGLDPPDTPDLGECCAVCPIILGYDAIEVPMPGAGRWRNPVWVCSHDCKAEYLSDYGDWLYDRINTEAP